MVPSCKGIDNEADSAGVDWDGNGTAVILAVEIGVIRSSPRKECNSTKERARSTLIDPSDPPITTLQSARQRHKKFFL